MATEQQELVTVTLDGVKLGVFDAVPDGGGASAPVSKYRPGGMGDEVSEKALPTYDDLTVSRRYDPVVDQELVRFALTRAGVGDVSVNRQPIDGNKNPVGKPITSIGTLMAVSPGPYDSNSSATKVWGLSVSVIKVA